MNSSDTIKENILKAATLIESSGISDFEDIFISCADRSSGTVSVKKFDVSRETVLKDAIDSYPLYGELPNESTAALSTEIFRLDPKINACVMIRSDTFTPYMLFEKDLVLSGSDFVFELGGSVPFTKESDPTAIEKTMAISRDGAYAAVIANSLGLLSFAPDPFSAAEQAVSLDYVAKVGIFRNS